MDIRNLKELERVLAEHPDWELKSVWNSNRLGESYYLYDDVNCVILTVDGRAAAAWKRKNNG